ncbi:GumC family protein [Undibacterium sp. RuRC25W]|uniref:GumC family protein n=1 Tax=Undibacterium sp. RuRC25W TaxID=3413047 RepID=UPI003BF13363
MDTNVTPVKLNLEQHASKELHEFEEKLDFVEYWKSITKRKWSILGFGVVIAMLAAVIVFIITPVYRSSVTLLIDATKSKVVQIDEVYSGFSENHDYFITQVEILKSPDIALKTISKLKLWENPEFDPRKKQDTLLSKFLIALEYSTNIPKKWDDQSLARAVLPKFNQRLSIEPVRLSLLVKVNFESENKELAALVANTMARSFIDSDLDVRFQMTQRASAWLEDRMVGVREKLDASEKALQAYRDQAGIVDVKSDAQSGAGKQIEEVTQRLVETRLRRAEAENAYNQIKNAPKGADLSSLPAVVRNVVVAEALKQQAEADRKLSEISQRYGSEHPKYVQAEGEAKTARENVKRQIDTVVQSVTREYEVAKGTENMLVQTLNQAKGSVQGINRKEFQLNLLEREVDSNKQIYDLFLKRAKETNVSSDLQNPVGRVVDEAKIIDIPVKPQKLQIISAAFVIGLLIAAASSLLIDLLDNTLKSTNDVETKLKQPLLTSLPLLDRKKADRSSTAHIFLEDPKSLYSESIRTARTGVLLSSVDLTNRILLVTSSVPGEGKTTFSINLAVAHSHTKKTLLIDADMRRPAVAKGLDLDPHLLGLSDLVAGTASFGTCVKTVEGSDLHVITTGTPVPNPLEIILSQRFKDTISELSKIYDIVIIDSPPVELVSDALVLSKMASGVIYVVKALETPYQLARKGLTRIRRAEGKILGVVLNHLDFKKAEKYYGEYSGYGKYGYDKYGYGDNYGSEEEKKA